MPSELALLELARRYQLLMIALGDRVSGHVGLLWDRFAGLDERAAEEFARRAAVVVTAAQTQSAGATNAYLNGYVGAASGQPLQVLIDMQSVLAGARGGNITPLDIYRRSIITARKVVSDGNSFAQAMSIGRARATSTAKTDVMLAGRRAARDTIRGAGTRVVGYRRLPNAKACPLCLTASTQRYHSDQLLPIHSDCACSVVPIVGTQDPGQIIDKQRLAQLKASSSRPDYWNDPKAAIAVHEHGELGPTLTQAGHEFTSPADLDSAA